MIIAKSGDYELCLPTYICKHDYMTHDLEICKREHEHNSKFTIANFNEYGEIVSCNGRLLKELNDIDSIDSVQKLADIAEAIIATENVQSGYGKMGTVTCTSYYPNGKEKETHTYKKPTDQDLEVWEAVRDMDCEAHFFYIYDEAVYYVLNGKSGYCSKDRAGLELVYDESTDQVLGSVEKIQIK